MHTQDKQALQKGIVPTRQEQVSRKGNNSSVGVCNNNNNRNYVNHYNYNNS